MKYFFTMVLALFASQVSAKGFACSEWTVPAYQEGGQLIVLMTDDRLVWTNGITTHEAAFVYSGVGISGRVYAADNTLYLVSGLSSVEIRRVHMVGAQQDSITRCTESE